MTNLQGDVMGLVDTSGNPVASYTYDPYGKVLTATGTLAEKNPLRYRGYYFDSESGLYYLQSRYYDPATRRFVNADSYAGTGQGLTGYNMFSYCSNGPIIRSDPGGNFGILGIIAVGAVVGGLLGAFSAATTGGNILESAIEGCLTGALGAACAFLPLKPIWTITISMVGGALVDLGVDMICRLDVVCDKEIYWNDFEKFSPFLKAGEYENAERVIRAILKQHESCHIFKKPLNFDELLTEESLDWMPEEDQNLVKKLALAHRGDPEEINRYLLDNLQRNNQFARFCIRPRALRKRSTQ